MRVLSVDIGTINYTCCAVNFSKGSDLAVKFDQSFSIKGQTYGSVEIVDVFNVDLGKGVKGTKALDILVECWDQFAVFQAWQPDVVLIEQQHSRASLNFMLSIATFTLSKKSFMNCQVKFVRPLCKFAGYKRFFSLKTECPPLRFYKQRKQAAVQLTNLILSSYFGVDSIEKISRSEGETKSIKKLDDFADAFLQAFCV